MSTWRILIRTKEHPEKSDYKLMHLFITSEDKPTVDIRKVTSEVKYDLENGPLVDIKE